MSKAFIFDLDGVLIDSELVLEKHKQHVYNQLFGQSITSKLGSTIGLNIDSIYDKAIRCGARVSKQELFDSFLEVALQVYKEAPLTKDIDKLATSLIKEGYALGIVSASPQDFIDAVLSRLRFKDNIQCIISLHELENLRHKPNPDGYQEAMKRLGTNQKSTIILEDSNPGIESAKASGAYTIGFEANLVEGYVQIGADAYAKDISDVIRIVQDYQSRDA